MAALLPLVGAGSLALGGETKIESIACSEAIVLRVSDTRPKQGAIFVVEVRSAADLDAVDGFWAGEALHFWHDAQLRVFQALLGVDLRKRPGKSRLRIRASSRNGPPVECSFEFQVVDGDFPVQRLSVAPKYVVLSPENLARAQREQAELNDIFSSLTPERLWRRGFDSPVSGYRPSGSFGKRRVFNNQPRRPHSGEDYSAPAGTPVRAPARGRVELAKGLFFLGNTVVLDHGFGLISFYGHLSSIAVARGAMVDTGTVLGNVGATGRVTGAHLHWGLRLGDARVDPKELLTLAR